MASGRQPKYGYPGLRVSFTCAEAIAAGQVVERRIGTDLVGVAGAGSVVVAGVALWDVPATTANYEGGPKVGDGHELTVVRNCVIKCTASGAILVGAKVKAAAAGKVAAWDSVADTADKIIGEAYAAIADTAEGLVYLY